MLTLRKTGLTLAGLSAVALLTSATHAQTTTSIPVANNGFEAPAIGPGATDGNTPTGWTYNGTQIDTSEAYATGVQAGSNTGKTGNQYGYVTAQYANPGGYELQQNTGFAVTAGDTYTLTSSVYTTNSGYARLELTSGSNSYFSPVVQPIDVFATQSVTFTALPGASASPLIIDLLLTDSNGVTTTTTHNGFAAFDNVILTQIAPAPEPAAWAGLAVGALGLGALSLRARRRTPCA